VRPACGFPRPYLFSGARPSSGTARPKQVACRQKSSALEQAELAAPEDGRAPLNTYPRPRGKLHESRKFPPRHMYVGFLAIFGGIETGANG